MSRERLISQERKLLKRKEENGLDEYKKGIADFSDFAKELDRQKVESAIMQLGARALNSSTIIEFLDNNTSDQKPTDSSNRENLSELDKLREEALEKNFAEAVKEKKLLDNELLAWQLILRMAEEELRANNSRGLSTRNEITDQIRKNIIETERKLTTLAESTPEAWGIIHGLELRDNIQEIDDNRIVQTPQVKEVIGRIKNFMRSGSAVFLHGHLGTGKTEALKTAATEVVIEDWALREAHKDYDQWLETNKQNNNLSAVDRRTYLAKAYRRHESRLFYRFRKGDPEVVDKVSPLFISGSRDLTSQDLYSEKTLKLTKFNDKTILEHKRDIDSEFKQWQGENSQVLNQMTSEERRLAEAEAANHILELYKLKNQAFGTEVETIQKEIYRGVIEGRPVIIDEVNAISSAVLISMNDILQRRPGQNCFIPGVGSVKIQPGFSIAMTGNLSSGSVSYDGTNDLNPAFLSRLNIIGYDYLPQSCTDRGYNKQSNPVKNEMFRLILSYLVDNKGHLQIPEKQKSLSQLFSLAQLARTTQDIFSGKWDESHMSVDMSGDSIEPRLEKSVLSNRNVINVLREWNKGADKDLDMALWHGFISSITDPGDQAIILSLAQSYNFFKNSNGWDVSRLFESDKLANLEELRTTEYKHIIKDQDLIPMFEVLEYIFGQPPVRTDYPRLSKSMPFKKALDKIIGKGGNARQIEETSEKQIEKLDNTRQTEETSEKQIEELQKFEEASETIKKMNEILSVLDALSKKEGCSVDNSRNSN